MRIVKVDKLLRSDEKYKPNPYQALKITHLGADFSDSVSVAVAEFSLGGIHGELNSAYPRDTNMLGPLDLKDLPIIVLPDVPYSFPSATAGYVRVKGEIALLAPGEVVPADWAERYTAQKKHFFTHEDGSFTLATDEAWAAGREITLYERKADTKERLRYRHVLGATFTNVGTRISDIGLVIYLDRERFDVLESAQARIGISARSAPLPPTDTTNIETFTLEDKEIVLEPGITLTINAINTSTANITPPAGEAISGRIRAVVDFERIEEAA